MKYIRVTNQNNFAVYNDGTPFRFYIFAFETTKKCIEFAEKYFNNYQMISAKQAKRYFKNNYGICQNCGKMSDIYDSSCFCDYLENLEWDKNNKETF